MRAPPVSASKWWIWRRRNAGRGTPGNVCAAVLFWTVLAAVSFGSGLVEAQDLAREVVARENVAREDAARLCPLVPEKLVGLIAKQAEGQARCEIRCEGCGCKGGPGYRKNTKCVGWSELIKECGPPPHARCSAECEPVVAGCSGRAWIKDLATKAGVTVQFAKGEKRDKSAEGNGRTKRKTSIEAGAARPAQLKDSLQADVFGEGGSAFTCAGKRRCGEMESCAEAKFYLSTCGVKSLDGDRDGVPCNALCR